ncbi:thiol-disulfide oxidoreductase DCC family protein [Hymenobacter aerilatus]|uniref:Thiol-disulfide oxidoreductase DCC family protein n=1 Tax=Hymenobacter aerilatus TaxID=2932251 RepID=A0A8T9T0J8_9BACT|nr:thiol-disulfide oxidoreductase DCC family protein [Hymenobacter aerilatus]UOR06020.1 thiol-disulfide oxidoreductase DCC family protein [Hymenobacter aerilatus]
MPQPPAVILFDGVCNLCNGFVQFVIARDAQAHFQFASLQSGVGQALLATHGAVVAATPETVVLVENGRVFTHSEAVLRIMRHLPGWRWLYALRVVPRKLRDAAYRWVASHRYRWFGREEACWLPTPALRARFL